MQAFCKIDMKLKSIILSLLIVVASAQTMWAQKVVIQKKDGQKFEFPVSELVNIEFLSPSLDCPDENHPHAIDLGLPSGTKWACCNVGASSPGESGGYYAWGETCEKEMYDWEYYADWEEGQYGNPGSIAGLFSNSIAGSSLDVATVVMGAPWCMPTNEQQGELVEYCTFEWAGGLLVTGKNGGRIFMPATGCKPFPDDNTFAEMGEPHFGSYWSDEFSPEYNMFGRVFSFYYYEETEEYEAGLSVKRENYNRCDGLTVRAVCP